MSKQSDIFFDLDHTLWDFDRNCSETLEELFHHYNLPQYGEIKLSNFIATYKEINKEMWRLINTGKATIQDIRSQRFPLTFKRLGISGANIPKSINEDFMRLCPEKSNLMPYVHETLSYLQKRYNLYILTNGFFETQTLKITNTGIGKYFKGVFHSDSCGYFKPDKRMFLYALEQAKVTDCSRCTMVGDDLDADVIGARNAGMNTVYYNPEKKQHTEKTTFEINCLSELKAIL
ncbi:YjjG family noncanonical pyrimidine nucleotidase [Cytophagaceae bacterium ABcell3]|nr:YjjG family noncanonical pyrimidine nucleotidase [Cytophagaceae bacterium ABcell3]